MLFGLLQTSQISYKISNQNKSLLLQQVNAAHGVFQGFCLSLKPILRATIDQHTEQGYTEVSLIEI